MNPQLNPSLSQFEAIDGAGHTEVSAFMKLATRMGWEITSIDDFGIHLKQKKTFGAGYAVIGALTAIFLIGFIVIVVGLVEYICKRDRILFVPFSDLHGTAAINSADLLL